VPTLSVKSWSKLRPFSGKSFTSFSLTNPEVELSVVFTRGASAVTVTCCATFPTSNVIFTTACWPTTSVIPRRTCCLNPVFSAVISY